MTTPLRGDIMIKSVNTKIRRWGNSQGIMLSKKLLSSIGIADPQDQEITIEVNGDQLILKKRDQSQSRLMQNYGYLINEPNSGEFDWGPDVGNEIIDD